MLYFDFNKDLLTTGEIELRNSIDYIIYGSNYLNNINKYNVKDQEKEILSNVWEIVLGYILTEFGMKPMTYALESYINSRVDSVLKSTNLDHKLKLKIMNNYMENSFDGTWSFEN